MTPGEQLRAWRHKRGLSLAAVSKLTGIAGSTWGYAERDTTAKAGTAARILAATGIAVAAFVPPSRAFPVRRTREADRHCSDCCGLPHRRPTGKLCRCGEAWAPDVVQHPVPGLRSSASWCGDYAGAGEEL